MTTAIFPTAITHIEDVLSYKHPLLLHRLQAKEGLDGREATALVEDMLRFLFLCGTSEQVYAPTERIDVAWHHFILFTRDYRQFCLQHFDRLIEHNPTAEKSPQGVIDRTLDEARRLFGHLSENWRYITADCSNVCEGQGPAQCSKCSGSTSCNSK